MLESNVDPIEKLANTFKDVVMVRSTGFCRRSAWGANLCDVSVQHVKKERISSVIKGKARIVVVNKKDDTTLSSGKQAEIRPHVHGGQPGVT
jgi:hypothetical protein